MCIAAEGGLRRFSVVVDSFRQDSSWDVTIPPGSIKNLMDGVDRVGSGQEVFKISRVRSGHVESGRVGSNQENFKSHGSGWVDPHLIRPAGGRPTRENPWFPA